jgi:hypothetical protein
MSGLFEEREKGYEAKWAHDQETHFKVLARRDRLLAQWAAELMKITGPGADAYAGEVMNAGMRGKERDPVFEKIRNDLKAGGIDCSDRTIHRKMEELFERASHEIAGPAKD